MGIRLKLIIFFVSIAIIPIALVTTTLIMNSTIEIKNLVVHEEELVVDQKTQAFESFLDQFKFIGQSLPDFPAVQGIILALPTGIDLVNKQPLNYWKTRLQQIFTALMRSKSSIYQLQFLDKNGHELVKVVRDNGILKSVDDEKLQDKSSRYYFKEGMKLNKGETYISDIDLNEENGKVEIPFKPMIRLATPVFDNANQSIKGVIVINVDVTSLLDVIQKTKVGHVILINQDGTFLLHPDKKMEFAPQLGLKHNYFSERPEIEDNLKKYDQKNHYDAANKEFRILEKILYNPSTPNRYWVLFSVIQEKELLAPTVNLARYATLLLAVVLIFSAFFAYALAINISRPIGKIADVAKEIASGHYGTKISNVDVDVDVDVRDETILLSRTINKMSDALKASFEKNAKKNDALKKNNIELENFNRAAVGREMRVIQLKQEINKLSLLLGKAAPYDLSIFDKEGLSDIINKIS